MTFDFAAFIDIIAFLIIWIQLPGSLICRRLLPGDVSGAVRLLTGFFVGVVLAAILYYIEGLVGLPLLLLQGPVLSLFAVICYIKNKKLSFTGTGVKLRPTWIILFVGIYIMSVLSFQLKHMGAAEGATTQVFHDYLFHTGNIAALSRSFPALDIRVSSVTFYYHYFTDLFFAMAKHIFGMSAFAIYMNGNALMAAWPLTLGLIILGERITDRKPVSEKRYFVSCAGIFASCICLYFINIKYAAFPLSWLNNHFFTNGNSLGITVAVHILMLELLAQVWDRAYSHRYTVLIFILTIAATTIKGTTGALVVAVIWGVFIIQSIITRTFKKNRLIYAIASALGFIVAYVAVVSGLTTTSSNNRAVTLSPAGTVASTRVGQVLELLGIDYSGGVVLAIASIFCIICMVGPLIIPLVGFITKKCKPLFKEKSIGDIYDWFAIGTILIGLIGFALLSIPGFSQGYMVITGSPFIFYCAMRYVWRDSITERDTEALSKHVTALPEKRGLHHFTILWTRAFMIIGSLFIVADAVYFIKSDIAAWQVYASETKDADDFVDADTLSAYFWLRDNTDDNATIAVDRLTESLDYREIYFYASAFSERQCYLEGYDYSNVSEEQVAAMKDINERFYSEDIEVAESAMDINYIDYLVVTKHSHPDYEPSSPRLQLVYSNDSVEIYEFLRYE